MLLCAQVVTKALQHADMMIAQHPMHVPTWWSTAD